MLEIDPVNAWVAIGFAFSILVLGIIVLFTDDKPEPTLKHKHHKKRRRHH